jgi:hypothetical protein
MYKKSNHCNKKTEKINNQDFLFEIITIWLKKKCKVKFYKNSIENYTIECSSKCRSSIQLIRMKQIENIKNRENPNLCKSKMKLFF